VIVTAGGRQEPIDPVRAVANAERPGFASTQAADRGACDADHGPSSLI
jgi:phosphopantothenoylcysteine synthetase/decarboxylase